MIENFSKHHIGIVVPLDYIEKIELRLNRKFHFDKIQGVRVIFHWNSEMNLYEEYIVKEGRAKNYPLGLHHTCYNIPNLEKLSQLHNYLLDKKIGFRLTFPETSGSQECGLVSFYKVINMGIVEFNIPPN